MKQQTLQHLERKKNDFNTKWRSFFETKFRENQENPHIEGWFKFPGAKRSYYTIEDYKVVASADMIYLSDDLSKAANPRKFIEGNNNTE